MSKINPYAVENSPAYKKGVRIGREQAEQRLDNTLQALSETRAERKALRAYFMRQSKDVWAHWKAANEEAGA